MARVIQWHQSGLADGSNITGLGWTDYLGVDKDSARMEGLLKDSSRACKEAAAVTTVWVHNTHHSLQRQEFRWEWLRQEVREQKKEVQTLTVEETTIGTRRG